LGKANRIITLVVGFPNSSLVYSALKRLISNIKPKLCPIPISFQ